MDRRRRRAGALGLLLTLAAGGALAADAAPPLRAMRWLPHGADAAAALARQPAECLRLPADPGARLAVEVGRAAFRTPLLLGGQAARAGLSCEACHRQGRGNPDFRFPGASGVPGTADVTLSLFSSRRGNGVDDPRPIPDLTAPRDRLKVAAADLPGFIRGLVVEEFDGPEPSAATLAGLAAYVRALDPAACPAGDAASVRVGVGGLMADARRALAAGRATLAGGDGPTTVLMVAAARARLGLIDERYAGLPAERARLRAADAGLAALQAAVRDGRREAAAAMLERWVAASRPLEARLRASEAGSLFDPARLNVAANRRLPPRPS
ncbi:MAG: hypothetical protein JNL41_07270 [Phenylobacterium sp.]|uniref:hypothetical protein n=1 Tax=Phenylobacterium sp. TaxID=1871053 RepID=UPI001A494184|nr:hypothetical protein [Phenylobacterium sp.]MBL8554061.1 hypothetical protein [Phenylobacterium sp.]